MFLPPILRSERLLLRPMEQADVDAYHVLLQDPAIAANGLGINYPYQEGDAERMVQRALQNEDEHRYTWAIVMAEANQIIGLIVMIISAENHHAELGYWVGKAYWNRGYMTEATAQVVDFGFRTCGLNRIFARTFQNNVASERVLQKVGMTYEGTLRQHMWHPWSEQFKDLLVYGILRSEYDLRQDEE